MTTSNDITPAERPVADKRSKDTVCDVCGGTGQVCEIHWTQLPNHIMHGLDVSDIDPESRHRHPEFQCRAAAASCPECDPDGPLPPLIGWL